MQTVQPSSNPPLQPTYVLRGHNAQIHSVHFLRQNSRLLTGDADGWVVLWDVSAKRSKVVWKPHDGGILKVADWEDERIITHGRDNKLHVWQLRPSDEKDFSTELPLEDAETPRKQPWLLHSVTVNALNFCGFTMSKDIRQAATHKHPAVGGKGEKNGAAAEVMEKTTLCQGNKAGGLAALFAGQEEGSVNAETRTEPPVGAQKSVSTTPGNELLDGNGNGNGEKTEQDKGILVAVPGFDEGQIHIWSLPEEERVANIDAPTGVKCGMLMALRLVYHAGALHLLAGYESGYTSIFRQLPSSSTWQNIYMQKSHTQPILSLCPAPSHGVYFTSGADSVIARHPLPPISHPTSASAEAKTVTTKHAGQQSLTVRSDSLIFATAGWDGRIRVYSTRSMRELAVLKWHKEGCYALALADVRGAGAAAGMSEADGEGDVTVASDEHGGNAAGALVAKSQDAGGGGLVRRATTDRVAMRREERARSTHWLAAGSKDGKVSLWDVY